jgi:predicted nucleotidyltransferase component of viral defense system
VQGEAHTLILSPVTEKRMAPPIYATSLSWEEAMAEKLRAALTRRQPAIRDFYDIFHAISTLNFSIQNPDLIELVKAKLAVPGNSAINLSDEKLESLRAQLVSELEPVLRPHDFSNFDLGWTYAQLQPIVRLLQS